MLKLLNSLARKLFSAVTIINHMRRDAAATGHKELFWLTLERVVDQSLGHFQHQLHHWTCTMKGLGNPSIQRLGLDVDGLHRQLSMGDDFSCTIVIVVDRFNVRLFDISLQSAMRIASAGLIVVCQRGASTHVANVLERLPDNAVSLLEPGEEEHIFELIIRNVESRYVLFADAEGWLRPDILYRFELLLRLEPDPSNVMISCASQELNDIGDVIGPARVTTPHQPHFPLIFQTKALESGIIMSRDRIQEVIQSGEVVSNVTDLALCLNALGVEYILGPFRRSSKLNIRIENSVDNG